MRVDAILLQKIVKKSKFATYIRLYNARKTEIMLIIQGKLVSLDVVEEQFVCNLTACKGACCWEGDFGAPLEKEELKILESVYEEVRPFLSEQGRQAIEEHGLYSYSEEAGEYGTTLINQGPCAYMTYNQEGIAQCGIEEAYRAGKSDFRKPISCHLYPIRVLKREHLDFEALNYDRWDICSAACTLGAKLKVPVYQFLKEALIRKYGPAFYEELEAAAAHLKEGEAGADEE
jgi:hypothetical protein